MPKRDKPSLIMRVGVAGLEPVGPYDAEVLARYELGAHVSVEIHQPRNMSLNAKYWAMLGRVVENSEWSDTGSLNKALLFEWGHRTMWRTLNGEVSGEAGSLTDLDDIQFREFFDWSVAKICAEIMPGMDPEKLLARPNY